MRIAKTLASSNAVCVQTWKGRETLIDNGNSFLFRTGISFPILIDWSTGVSGELSTRTHQLDVQLLKHLASGPNCFSAREGPKRNFALQRGSENAEQIRWQRRDHGNTRADSYILLQFRSDL